MIKKVTSLISTGELLTLDIEGASDDAGLLIISMDGISSPNATINTLEGPNIPGSVYNSKRIQQRNIVLTIAVTTQGDKEEEDKQNLYKFFPVGEQIILGITTHSKDVWVACRVESNPISQFAKIENSAISLICPFAWFYGVDELLLQFSGTMSEFSFPFSNESLTENLINFGEIVKYAVHNLSYPGDVESGVVVTMHARGLVQDIYLYNGTYNQTMYIDTSISIPGILDGFNGMVAGDDIIIDTRVGSKSIRLVRDGLEYNMINSLGIFSPWLTVFPRLNELSFSTTEGQDLLDISMRIPVLYSGV